MLIVNGHLSISVSRADGLPAAFAGADAHAVVERHDEDLAVADGAGVADAGGMDDGLDGRLHECVIDGDLELELGQQADLELLAAVDLGEAALPAATADVADGHQVDVALVQGPL